MSKVVVSLPEGMIKNSVIGAGVSLGCYILLQFLSAFLVCEGIVGEEAIYAAVCVAAAVSSFAGCFCSMMRTGKGKALSATTVVTVFLTLTVAIAVCVNRAGTIGANLPGIGAAMAAGGLVAAIVCGTVGSRAGTRREKRRNRRRRK